MVRLLGANFLANTRGTRARIIARCQFMRVGRVRHKAERYKRLQACEEGRRPRGGRVRADEEYGYDMQQIQDGAEFTKHNISVEHGSLAYGRD